MITAGEGIHEDLAAVRAALLAAAQADAQQTLRSARDRAAAVISEAQAEAGQIRAEAAQAGAADASTALATAQAAARRRARTIELRAHRQAYDALRAESAAAVTALVGAPEYADVRAKLTAAARRVLGPTATIRDIAAGGVIADADGRTLNLSLAALVEPAVAAVLAAYEQEARRDS